MQILIAQINPTIGDLVGNREKILNGIKTAKELSATIVIFPELSLCGYPPQDLLLLPHFITALNESLESIRKATKGITAIVGTARQTEANAEKHLYNSAAILSDGKLLGYQDKILLPTYDVFVEKRYFEPGAQSRVWEIDNKRIAITICEDLWQHSTLLKETNYARDPINELQKDRPDLLLNLSASPFSLSKKDNRLEACQKAAKTLHCPLILCNQVGGNDGLIFDGHSVYVDSKGNLIQQAKGFEEEFLLIDLDKANKPVIPKREPTEELFKALVLGLKDYFHKSGFKKACLGISGGIDSAVVACIAVEALGSQNVLGIAMPSRYSSKDSFSDAHNLVRNLQIDYREIPIEEPFEAFLSLLEPQFGGLKPDVTEENLQARIRGIILMALSNKLGHIVLSTGNKSELAMGYATLYGDMCGGLAVISDVTKRQVYELAKWINRKREIIPLNTIKKAPSAELRPNQKDSDSLPDYDIVDNVVQAYVEWHLSPKQISEKFQYPIALVEDLIKRIHCNEYKRRQSAPGLRVSEKAFSVGRHFPIVQRWVK